LPTGTSTKTNFSNLKEALADVDTQIRLFGKPDIDGRRRMGVTIARADSIEAAIKKANKAAAAVKVTF